MKMRSLVLRYRVCVLSRVAAAALLAGAAAGCSSDFSRFNAGLQSSAANSANPYPSGLDQTQTSSIGNSANGAPIPIASVEKREYEPDHAGYDPAKSNNVAYQTYGAEQKSASAVERKELPKAEYGPGKNEIAAAKIQTDAIETDSVHAAKAAPKLVANNVEASNEKGWTRTGGSTITLREGETLYNLSKRYGVPVGAIMKANGISNADKVAAGQRVIIPNYVYAAELGVSAPDNDAKTVKASSARGWNGEREVAALSITAGKTGESAKAPARLPAKGAGGQESVDPIITGVADELAKGGVAKTQEKSAAEMASKAEAVKDDSAPERSGIGVFRWPVRGRIVSNFGDVGENGRNDGIDISVPEGTAVKAVENGVVVYAGNELEGLGNLVLIQHSDGWVSAYAHNLEIEVKRGDEVRRGEIVSRSGRTGNAETPKLHFELRKYSKPVDPVRFLDGA